MKRTSITLIGFTTLVAPRIAPAQNAVIDWNSIAVTTALAGISFIPPNTPNGMALYLGYVHRAMNDAVNAIEHRFKPYGPAIAASAAASPEAAVVTAAYTMLQHHFPNQIATLTVQYNASLAALLNNGKANGVLVGLAASCTVTNTVHEFHSAGELEREVEKHSGLCGHSLSPLGRAGRCSRTKVSEQPFREFFGPQSSR